MMWTDRRKRFRAVLDGSECLSPASVFDPLSARIAEHIGFEFGILAGSVASHTILGAPDVMLVTLTELAEQCRRINRAVEIPLLVDADHGFGNALNAVRTAQELEMAGVSAITIEDTMLPAPYGGYQATRLVSMTEAADKLKAVIASRKDPDFAIIGRTTSIEGQRADLISRLRAYETCGVDGLFVSGVSTQDEIDAIAAAVGVPILLGRLPPPVHDISYLTDRGIRVVLHGHKPFLAAAQAIYETLSAERAANGTAPPAVMESSLFNTLLHSEAYGQVPRKKSAE
jgi:carboxyvinyl-carboxyphosphonate phosphorylmutase